jgi:hypothetical protein
MALQFYNFTSRASATLNQAPRTIHTGAHWTFVFAFGLMAITYILFHVERNCDWAIVPPVKKELELLD